MAARGNILANVDWLIIALFFILVILGVMNIYAADFNPANPDFFSLEQRSGKQVLWIGCSMFIALSILSIESRFYQSLSPLIFLLVLGMQVLVLLFAREVNGARAWLEIGPFKLQPAEFSKFATALFLSTYIAKLNIKSETNKASMEKVGNNFWRFMKGKKVFSITDISVENHLKPLGIIFLPVLMILLQDDTGTALVFFSFFFVLYREGIIGIVFLVGLFLITITILTLMFDTLTMYTALGFLAVIIYASFIRTPTMAITSVVVMIVYLILQSIFQWNSALSNFILWGWISINLMQCLVVSDLWKRAEKMVFLFILVGSIGYVNSVSSLYQALKPYQRSRIDIVLGKLEDRQLNFQTDQSLNAIGSGGLFGKGYLDGTHTKGNWVPEQSTDYIFCTVGEEWGFFGTSSVVLLFMALIFRIVMKAEMQRSAASRIYGYCVASILFFHLLVNIGMTIQIMPVIGIPLPFFSYGGSSLFGFTILLFMFVKFDSQRLDVL